MLIQQLRTTSFFAAQTPVAPVVEAPLVDCRFEVLQNSIKVGCNTRLKGVGNLPHKTDLKLYFELSVKGLSVVTDLHYNCFTFAGTPDMHNFGVTVLPLECYILRYNIFISVTSQHITCQTLRAR